MTKARAGLLLQRVSRVPLLMKKRPWRPVLRFDVLTAAATAVATAAAAAAAANTLPLTLHTEKKWNDLYQTM
jgi:hypothetical protein